MNGILICPGCGGATERRYSQYGEYICCRNYPGCDHVVGCHTDGRPLGTPANKQTRTWRKLAHSIFDALWRDHGRRRRTIEYAWLAHEMGLTKDECHIGMFDIEQCKQVIELVSARLQESGTTTTNGVFKDGREHVTDRQ